VRCVIKVREYYLKTKCRHAVILVNVNIIICFRFKLQLQFINNKKYSFVIVNFHTGLCKKKNINVKLKFRYIKSYHETNSPWYIVTLCCLNHLSNTSLTLLHSGFHIALWRGADKSLAQPGRKQATATKLRIYSAYSPQSSVHFLAHCSNFCKPPKKKSEGCPSNQVSVAAVTSEEKWQPFNCFFSPGNRW